MQISININGLAEVEKKFRDGIPKGVMTKILRTTGNTMRQQAIRNVQAAVYSRSVPWKRTGKLQQSIRLKADSESARVTVGVDYGKFIEYGTKPHVIRPKKGKFLFFQKQQPVMGGGYLNKKTGKLNKRASKRTLIVAREVHHPGTKAYPFWRPAIAYTKTQIPLIIKATVEAALNIK